MKKNITLIIILMILFIPVYANAASVSVSLNCPSTAKASSVISCTVVAKPSGSNLKGLQAEYKITNGTFESFTVGSGWTSYTNTAKGFSFGRTTETTVRATVGTLKVKMPATGSLTISLINVAGTDKNYATLTGNTPSASIRVQSTTNTLNSLSLSNGTLSPVFNSNTTNYTATIDAPSTVISATVTDSKSKITGIGTKTLVHGKNTLKVIVTSESGTTKTYTITITRPDNRSNNNNLKTLTTNQGTISFNKNTTTYNVNVDSNVSSITINGSVEDTKASFIQGYGPRTVNLNYGNNAIQIKVKAENTSIKTYTINVNRKDNRSSNNYLKDITLSAGSIVFNKDILEYNTTVYYDITKVNVTAQAEDSKSKVVVNSPNLNVGNNIITINVTSENGSVRTYKIIVKRLSEAEKMSDNNNIASLKVLGHEVDFKTDTLEYELNIKDEYALVFEINLEDPKASYKIEGNEDLKDGSVIKVVTTSESGQTKEYKFNVSKEKLETKKSNNSIMNIIFAIGGFFLGVGITLLLTKKKKPNNIDQNNNMNNSMNSYNNNNPFV